LWEIKASSSIPLGEVGWKKMQVEDLSTCAYGKRLNFTLPTVCSLGTMLSFMLGVGHGLSQVKASNLLSARRQESHSIIDFWD
jgi:hypothetical protein